MARALLYSHGHTRDLWISSREFYFTVTVTSKTCGFYGENFTLQSLSHPRLVDFMARALIYSHLNSRDFRISWQEIYFTTTVTPETCGFYGESFTLQSPSHSRHFIFVSDDFKITFSNETVALCSWTRLHTNQPPVVLDFHQITASLPHLSEASVGSIYIVSCVGEKRSLALTGPETLLRKSSSLARSELISLD
ncbi:hypothetical protein RRG08_013789 [Elysia crispata]|uniref:Uncharacterized protein n=1 Tax=Elysia crispata TaxID=231223 RepID=A0AAE1ED65_9GAST|nr:hypothetical protein RRG08_013789 [Elysia crispata]